MTSKSKRTDQRSSRTRLSRSTKSLGTRDHGGRVMTLAEIYRKYPNQWVLISEPRLTKDLEVIEGTVVAHSRSRDMIYKKVRSREFPRFAIEFTGEIPIKVGIAF